MKTKSKNKTSYVVLAIQMALLAGAVLYAAIIDVRLGFIVLFLAIAIGSGNLLSLRGDMALWDVVKMIIEGMK